MGSVCVDDRQEFRLSENSDFMSLVDQFVCLSVLSALGFPFGQNKILITNDEQRDLFADARLDGDACTRCDFGRLGSRKGQFAGKARNFTKQLASFVAFCRGRLLVRFLGGLGFCGFWPGGEYVPKFLRTFVLGHQDNLCGSFGVFGGIMVLKVQIQSRFQVCQPVTAIPLEFWPCVLRDPDTVMPFGAQFRDTVAFASTIDSAFVELAVLDQDVPTEKTAKRLNHLGKRRVTFDRAFVDAVKVNVEGVKSHFRVDQKAECVNVACISHHGQAELTDTGCVWVCSFHVQRNEAKCLLQNVVSGHSSFWPISLCGKIKAVVAAFCRDPSDNEKDTGSSNQDYNSHRKIQFVRNDVSNDSCGIVKLSTLSCAAPQLARCAE